MKKLLIIGSVWPEPTSSAAGSHMLEIIELFQSDDYEVTFACAASDSDFMFDLGSIKVNKALIILNCESFNSFVTELQPDIVLFDRFMIEEQFAWRVEQAHPTAMRLLDTEDLHCLRYARHQALKEERDINNHDLLKSEMAKREVAAILRCDLTLMISHVEIQILQDVFKVDSNLLIHLPFLLDKMSPQDNQWPSYSKRNHFLSIGNFRHAPNWDAVLYLKQTIWPLIRKQLPKAEIHIYGSYAPKKATQLHKPAEGFHILGRAEDAQVVMRQARVCLAPIRFGAGIKGKLVESMICGTPSITSSIGAESMHDDLPWNGFIEDNIQAFADAAVKIYQDEKLWMELQVNGAEIINQCYSKEVHSTRFLETFHKALDQLEEIRLNNFTGALLRHHSMRSTEFMSRWIELKNKVTETSS